MFDIVLPSTSYPLLSDGRSAHLSDRETSAVSAPKFMDLLARRSRTHRIRRFWDLAMRKKLVLIGLLPVGLGLGYLFYFGCAAGFALCKFCGGTESGIQGRVRSIIIPMHTHELHLHHWLLSAVATATSAIQGFSLIAPGLFYGVLGGLILQGILCYDDWHRIVRRRILCAELEPID